MSASRTSACGLRRARVRPPRSPSPVRSASGSENRRARRRAARTAGTAGRRRAPTRSGCADRARAPTAPRASGRRSRRPASSSSTRCAAVRCRHRRTGRSARSRRAAPQDPHLRSRAPGARAQGPSCLPRGGGDAIGRRPIRRARAEDDAPAIVTGGESGHERRERRLGPAPERVARAHVDDRHLVPMIHARGAQPLGDARIGNLVERHLGRVPRRDPAGRPGHPASADSSAH